MSLPTKAVLHAATYPRKPELGAPCNITIAQFNDWLAEQLRQAKEQAWDAVINVMKYEDGTPVELVTNINPYRSQK